LQEAQANPTKYASGKEIVFEVGDKVWLSMRHFRTTRPSKKLDYKRTGPYTVSKVINKNAYKLDLPYTIQKHNIFHLSFVDHYKSPTAGQPPSAPQPTGIDDSDEWEVNEILDSKPRYWKFHYLVHCAGYSYVRTSLEPAENLGTAQELVDQFHQERPRMPPQ
jgi:protein-tyrosine phosphatase